MDGYLENVAVVGAGLGGCAFALALSQKNVPAVVYELRPEGTASLSSGVLLTPNGLHVLDQLGVLSRIQDRCYIPTHRIFMNDDGEITEKTPIDGPEKWGYTNHRVWRQLLLDEMRLMLRERSVQICFNAKFNGILSDDADGVKFKINEDVHSASMVVGSDGLYSALRKHLAPDVKPWYTGLMGIAGHARLDSIEWPHKDYERNATIQGKAGAIVYMAEDNEKGGEAIFAVQIHLAEQSREDLDNLQSDPDRKFSLFITDKYDQWGALAQSVIEANRANKHKLFIWPFMRMPALPSWYSESGRIILIGDGAHCIPPSSAQGVNQALEDALSLALLLQALREEKESSGSANGEETSPNRSLIEALSLWQKWRQEKVDAIYDWTINTTDVGRLPEDARNKLIAEGKVKDFRKNDMAWLFQPSIEKNVKQWVQKTT